MIISFCKRAFGLTRIAKNASFYSYTFKPKYLFSTIEQPNKPDLNKLLEKFSVAPTSLKCHGCGAKLQWQNQKERGFILEDTLEKYIHKCYTQLIEEIDEDLNEESKNLSIENQKKLHKHLKMQLQQPNAQKQENLHLEVNDLDLTQDLENESQEQPRLKTAKAGMLKCLRCHSLQNYKNLDEEIRIGGGGKAIFWESHF